MLVFSLIVFFFYGSNFEKEVQDYLQETISANGKVEIIKIQFKKDFDQVHLDRSRVIKRKYNIAFIPIKINKAGRISEEYLSVQFKLYQEVLIAENDLNSEEIITAKSFKAVKQDVSLFNKTYCHPDSSYNGHQVKFSIKKGSVVFINDIEKIPVIKSGDIIKAEYSSPFLKLSIPVTARKNGCVGEIITVLTNSNKLLKARINQNRTVEIIE